MVLIEVSVDIDAAPAVVWQFVEQIDRHIEWMSDAKSITFVGTQTSGIGTRFVCATRIGPITLSDRMEVTEWTAGSRIAVHHSGAVTGSGAFELSPIGAGQQTRFGWAEELRFPWYLGGRLGELLGGAALIRWVWRRNLNHLKQLLESR